MVRLFNTRDILLCCATLPESKEYINKRYMCPLGSPILTRGDKHKIFLRWHNTISIPEKPLLVWKQWWRRLRRLALASVIWKLESKVKNWKLSRLFSLDWLWYRFDLSAGALSSCWDRQMVHPVTCHVLHVGACLPVKQLRTAPLSRCFCVTMWRRQVGRGPQKNPYRASLFVPGWSTAIALFDSFF